MYYPETLTAPLMLEHLGHEITLETYGRNNYTSLKITAVALECQTCGTGLALEFTNGGTV